MTINSRSAATKRSDRKSRIAQSDTWLGVGYLAIACVSLIFTRIDDGIALLWIATALLLPRLALIRPQHWAKPIIFCSIGSMIATTLFGAGIIAAPLLAVALMVEAVTGALLLRRFLPDGRFFDTIPRVGIFVGLVGFVAPACSAFIAAGAACSALGLPYWNVWLDWAVTHGLGTLTFMPIVTLAMRTDTRQRLKEIWAKWGFTDWCILVLAIAMNVAVFAQTRLPLLFLPMLPLILLTIRHGRIGASGAILLIAIVGGGLTTFGFGPVALIQGSQHQEMLFFQFFLTTCIITALPMAAEMNRRRDMARRLQDSEAMFRLMADRSGDVLFNLSLDGAIRFVSSSVSKVGGFKPEKLLGTASIDLVCAEDRETVTRAHMNAIRHPNETFIFEYRAQTGDGEIRWFETHARSILDVSGQVVGVVNSIRDVSHRKRLEKQLSDDANRDALTGLANRRVFDRMLTTALSQRSEGQWAGCLVIADVDHFKRVNDQHGHPVGDLVLQGVATVLTSGLRATETVCRIGGEEFGMILWGMRIDGCRELCDRLREHLADNPIQAPSGAVAVTISLGIVDIGNHSNVGDAIAAADKALYQAKQAGRNRLAVAA